MSSPTTGGKRAFDGVAGTIAKPLSASATTGSCSARRNHITLCPVAGWLHKPDALPIPPHTADPKVLMPAAGNLSIKKFDTGCGFFSFIFPHRFVDTANADE